MYFIQLRDKYVHSWDAWYANLVEHCWYITQMLLVIVYGWVWENRYDESYAFGIIVKTVFQYTLDEAFAAL